MRSLSLELCYATEFGRPFVIAKITDLDIIRRVAKEAVLSANREAKLADKLDPLMGALRKKEADRLKTVVKTVLPDLDKDPADCQAQKGEKA